jgi:hypothetical protein
MAAVNDSEDEMSNDEWEGQMEDLWHLNAEHSDLSLSPLNEVTL